MRLRNEEYSKRLEGFSTSTLRLISDLNNFDLETARKKSEIAANSELTETEVVERLKKLKESVLTKKET